MDDEIYEPDPPPSNDETAYYLFREFKRIADALNTVHIQLTELEARVKALEP